MVASFRHILHTVRDEQHRALCLLLISLYKLQNQIAPAWVEARGGLVQDEHLRLHRHHPRNRGATLFTAGEVKGRFFEIFLLEPYELRGAAHTLIDFPLCSDPYFWAKRRCPP